MHVRFSRGLDKKLKQIKRKNKRLHSRVQKQILLFSKNPKHRSLRIHKLSGKMDNAWSLSVNKEIRMIYLLLDHDRSYFIDIGTHEEVYKK